SLTTASLTLVPLDLKNSASPEAHHLLRWARRHRMRTRHVLIPRVTAFKEPPFSRLVPSTGQKIRM
ncbi:hypothetical protein, partial [Brevibacterium aurantiacum]|uniref:hypothetical protein n=1 Tax=Brevibacterium aurantiacum TaxID=273384 RepID=UPI001D01FBA5